MSLSVCLSLAFLVGYYRKEVPSPSSRGINTCVARCEGHCHKYIMAEFYRRNPEIQMRVTNIIRARAPWTAGPFQRPSTPINTESDCRSPAPVSSYDYIHNAHRSGIGGSQAPKISISRYMSQVAQFNLYARPKISSTRNMCHEKHAVRLDKFTSSLVMSGHMLAYVNRDREIAFVRDGRWAQQH